MTFHRILRCFCVFPMYIVFSGLCYSINLDHTHLLKQYALFCGSDTKDGFENSWFLPSIQEYSGFCSKCSIKKDCYIQQNCCPHIELMLPERECKSDVIFSSRNTPTHRYEVVTKCPVDADETYHKKCLQKQNIAEFALNSPVLSKENYVSYANKYCALCYGVTDVVPWLITVYSTVCENLTVYDSAHQIIKTIVKEKCGEVSYFTEMEHRVSCATMEPNAVVGTCNKTGTWKTFDKYIDYACKSMNLGYKFFKNIFCAICNPPVQNDASEPVSTCSTEVTVEKAIETACLNSGTSAATYPYKNIYCYLCNVGDKRIRSTYETWSSTEIRYYSLSLSDPYLTKILDNQTAVLTNSKIFVPWVYLIKCLVPLPISHFEDNLRLLLKLARQYNCIIERNQDKGLFLRIRNKNDTQSVGGISLYNTIKVHYAYLSEDGIVHVGVNGREQDYKCSDNILIEEIEYKSSFCNPENYQNVIDRNILIFPFDTLMCLCTTSIENKVAFGQPFPTNLFRFQSYESLLHQCRNEQIYDDRKMQCRQVGCFYGKILHDGNCIGQGYSYDGYTFPFLVKTKNLNEFYELLNKSLIINESFSATFCPVTEEEEEEEETEKLTLIQLYVKNLNSSYNQIETESDLIDLVSFVATDSTWSRQIELIQRHNISSYGGAFVLRNTTTYFKQTSSCRISNRPFITKLLICPHVKYVSGEYDIMKDYTVYVPVHDIRLNFYEFNIEEDGSLLICKDRFDIRKESNLDENIRSVIVLIFLNAISALFLVITFITYCCISSMRNLPGINIMSLSFSLFCHNISFIFVLTTKSDGFLCTLVGILSHYFLLTSFGCLFVCALHIFKIFGTGSVVTTVDASGNKSLTWKYILVSYGYALVTVIIYIGVSASVTSGESIGYGHHKCFITYKEGLICALLIPLAIFSTTDVILFVITVFRLRNRPRLRCNDSMKRRDIWIFSKLFVTTGCSWILFLVNSITDESILALIISSLNSLQGMYIFIAYICNRRVFNLFQMKFKNHSNRTLNTLKKRSPSTSLTSLSRIRTGINCKHSSLNTKDADYI